MMDIKHIIEGLELEAEFLETKKLKIEDAIIKLKDAIIKLKDLDIPTNKTSYITTKRLIKRRSKDTTKKKKEIEKLLDKGKLSRKEIANKVDVNVSSIYNWFPPKKKDKVISNEPVRSVTGRIVVPKKKLFPDEIQRFIEENYKRYSDNQLRELIGDKFNKWYDIDQIRDFRESNNFVIKIIEDADSDDWYIEDDE